MRLNDLTRKPLMVKINVCDDTPLKLHQRAKHVLEGWLRKRKCLHDRYM